MPAEFLKKHGDYQRVYREGRKGSAPLMGWFVASRLAETPPTISADNEEENSATRSDPAAGAAAVGTRIGLTVPKTLGKAVDRNRMKRRMREAVRRQPGDLFAPQLDVVLHPRRSVLTCEFDRLEREVGKVLREVAIKRDVKRGDSK
jgi:ribonuclease P protein component